jgi:phosphopantothenoylcysteine decarboxylase/phosphopantothenate--cysteine ligase
MRDLLASTNWNVIILAAAVSDYLVKNYVDGKIRSRDAMTIELEPAEKIISVVRKAQPTASLIGFKLLVNSTDAELVQAAQKSAIDNDCRFVVANDLRDIQADKHRLLIVGKKGLIQTVESDPRDPEALAKAVAGLAFR